MMRHAGGLVLVLGLLLGCDDGALRVTPEIPTMDQACTLDGMLLAFHSGPKAQVLRRNGERAFYCDTKEAFPEWLDPVRRKRVAGLWFQTLEDGPWDAHTGGWSPAEGLLFVAGSRKLGGMGPTLAPFRTRVAAAAFVAEHGGTLLRLDEIDADVLDGLRRQGMQHLGEE